MRRPAAALSLVLGISLWPVSASPCDEVPGAHWHEAAGRLGLQLGLGWGHRKGPNLYFEVGRSPPVVVAQAPPVVLAAPPPSAVVVVAAPAPAPAAPVEPAAPALARVAFKWAPLGWASRSFPAQGSSLDRGAGSAGMELRLARSFSLRSDLEYGAGSPRWNVAGIKLSFWPGLPLRPYGSLSLSGHQSALEEVGQVYGTALHLGAVAAVGLDLHLGRHFFLEAEARYRVAAPECCSEAPRYLGLLGGGVAF